YLASPEGSIGLAGPTFEHPLKGFNKSKEVKGFGSFRPDSVTINQLGLFNAKAISLMAKSGWK
ncbi:MAG: iron ABC transporter substrate-binding protein, partial [Prochlorococcaceae cyanobacterium ETNP1_MAG_8]|nr:iron ABC transporter substrate-binding protein [Prochlorococcaceae cyanobacterium ETNP1_MAG_8]